MIRKSGIIIPFYSKFVMGKGVVDMNFGYLKKLALPLILLLFLLQGCAFYVRAGHGEYYEHYPHHYYYRGYWR